MPDKTRALVVDDEKGVRVFLGGLLKRSGHEVVTASKGQEALDRLRESNFDLVMLDLKLGGRVDGIRVLETVKWKSPDTVVIILTGHGTLNSAMTAIREGVDGYLLKPVQADDVRRAIQDALRRRSMIAERIRSDEAATRLLQAGPFSVDLERHTASLDGERLDLSPSEFDLLAYLVENSARVLPPPELVRAVRGYECDHLHEAREIIKWYVHRLRRKIESDPSNPQYLLNVRGVGYRLMV